MRDRIGLLSCLAIILGLFVFPGGLSAHSTIVSTEPAQSEVVEKPLEQVRVQFNETVEPVRFEVENSSGEAVAAKAEANGKTLTAAFDEPLSENGSYTATWHVIGADGHAIKGSLSFEVRIPEAPASPAATASASASSPESTSVEGAASSPAATPEASPSASAERTPQTEGSSEEDNKSSSSPDLSTWLLGAAAVILVGAVGYTVLRKKK
ncbi:hypothetical protein J19TS2_22610 [Cohnella xylanilytica]|uniref:Copper resistance protein CopC n=1 Tax=Cohnella xylanilytica TaxID=557555 RepID=A0A841U3U1_9BACL|nr:copper resistance CopC family protein [Cohnella xylanilytica]MBB6692751.1 copper resistance protein CopC [Cohnella xylanilytica]GIO12706.1 hypothetical protein J19TS2_22610 [Cohnella xylanilytica]